MGQITKMFKVNTGGKDENKKQLQGRSVIISISTIFCQKAFAEYFNLLKSSV